MENASEALIDQLRGGDFGDVLAAASSASEAQLCVKPDGGVGKADPHKAFVGGQAPQVEESADDELRRLREARLAQIKEESTWRQQGHGKLRELVDEHEFVEAIRPHARAIVLLDDGRPGAGEQVHEALVKLAKVHLEAQFLRLHSERAYWLTEMVDLEGFPAVFVLRDGQVTRHLSPSHLFAYASASSPLFTGHLAKLLYRVGGLTTPEAGSDSEDEDEG
mmetsp:Transcript_60931/g.132169  ORF Transcript_60931/g.132169 Transcript_60931/m.132169 type:complete len:221 (-) Transcript_60931:126-788(-)